MRALGLPALLVFLIGCPGGDKQNDTAGGLSGGTACDVSPAACDEDGDAFKPSEGDCDDNDSSVNPGELETCNGRDDNCDGVIDEGVGSTWYQDYDLDGFGNIEAVKTACEAPEGYVANGTDCNDAEPRSFPGNEEVCDEIDNNCDGTVDEGVTTAYFADADTDGYGDPASRVDACEAPAAYVLDNTDCDDSTARSYPGNPEVCDTLDNDCDGMVDEGVTTTYYADVDGDGYGNILVPDDACSLPTGYAETPDDCDDSEATVHPNAAEFCNGVDDDCDGTTDEPDAVDASTWYVDTDVDGYGNASISMVECYQPAGYVLDGTDCDDARFATNPGASEYCNGYDDDCDGATDEDSALDATTWYRDADSDAYGDSAIADVECTAPSGYVSASGDCDDTDNTSFPGGIEVCDGADNDCNGLVDDSPTDGTSYYADADGDGLGDAGDMVSECAMPAGYADNDYDCDDADSTEPVVADAISGSAAGTGQLSNPYASIQDAIDDAVRCVIAYPGTYNESISLGGKSLDVWGVEGADLTTIDPSLSVCSSANPAACASAVEIASNSGASPTLHGFTIKGGTGSVSSSTTSEACADSSASHTGTNTCTVTTYTYCGGGIHIEGDDPILEDLIVYDNELPVNEQVSTGDFTQAWLYSFGGGVCAVDANVGLDGVWIINNYADSGGGLYSTSSSVISAEHTIVAENDASDGGGLLLAASTFTANNSVVACNSASTDGGGVFTEDAGSFQAENLVFFGNASATSGSARGADVWVGSTTTFSLINSVVENNIATALLYGTGAATLQYNTVYNDHASGSTYGGSFSAGTGSISMGSNFGSPACDGNARNDDWTLDSASGGVDGGNPAAAYDDVDGSNNDMGAYGGPGGDW